MSLADLIQQWLNGSTNRSAAELSRLTGVPKNTISAILLGRRPGVEVAARLGKVLPRDQVVPLILREQPEMEILIGYTPAS
jgi:plasmid maintenance system antidote protein VapI